MVFLLLFFLNFRGENVKRIVVKSIKLVEIWSFGKKLYILPDFSFHISIDFQNYSVPYEYVRKKVDVRYTKSSIEVYYKGNRICSHKRLYGRRGQYSTLPEHMPANHRLVSAQ